MISYELNLKIPKTKLKPVASFFLINLSTRTSFNFLILYFLCVKHKTKISKVIKNMFFSLINHFNKNHKYTFKQNI